MLFIYLEKYHIIPSELKHLSSWRKRKHKQSQCLISVAYCKSTQYCNMGSDFLPTALHDPGHMRSKWLIADLPEWQFTFAVAILIFYSLYCRPDVILFITSQADSMTLWGGRCSWYRTSAILQMTLSFWDTINVSLLFVRLDSVLSKEDIMIDLAVRMTSYFMM